uniref:Adenosine 5'-monophosphoramidase HINT3 n=1 Tax=Branchiostoma floridae TaxID=7739 RepID=C3ZNC1_BRAFL|eukprot:XP_002589938.1 hypothetical protein BRAFLDRAFT_96045 [Branchiostoma floridae]
MAGCIFCNIARGEEPMTTILYEDEKFVSFRDQRPGAPHHYLVIPKMHVGNPSTLTNKDIPLDIFMTCNVHQLPHKVDVLLPSCHSDLYFLRVYRKCEKERKGTKRNEKERKGTKRNEKERKGTKRNEKERKGTKYEANSNKIDVESLAEVGNKVLQEQGGNMEDKRLGFHWPPFNTVDHLCLHVLSPTSQMSLLSSTIYSTTFWFMTVEKLLEKLEAMPADQ